MCRCGQMFPDNNLVEGPQFSSVTSALVYPLIHADSFIMWIYSQVTALAPL